jgi:putative acetyltransferase
VPSIRVEQPHDYVAIAHVVATAFDSEPHADLVEAIRKSSGFIPELSLVAEVEERVVGHVMISYVQLRDGETERQVPSLSPLAVLPGSQRKGIGAALVREVTSRADARGESLVVLEGDPEYYGRLGFEAAASHGITIDLPSWAPREAAQVMRLTNDDPSIRGHVAYPAAFDVVADR